MYQGTVVVRVHCTQLHILYVYIPAIEFLRRKYESISVFPYLGRQGYIGRAKLLHVLHILHLRRYSM